MSERGEFRNPHDPGIACGGDGVIPGELVELPKRYRSELPEAEVQRQRYRIRDLVEAKIATYGSSVTELPDGRKFVILTNPEVPGPDTYTAMATYREAAITDHVVFPAERGHAGRVKRLCVYFPAVFSEVPTFDLLAFHRIYGRSDGLEIADKQALIEHGLEGAVPVDPTKARRMVSFDMAARLFRK